MLFPHFNRVGGAGACSRSMTMTSINTLPVRRAYGTGLLVSESAVGVTAIMIRKINESGRAFVTVAVAFFGCRETYTGLYGLMESAFLSRLPSSTGRPTVGRRPSPPGRAGSRSLLLRRKEHSGSVAA